MNTCTVNEHLHKVYCSLYSNATKQDRNYVGVDNENNVETLNCRYNSPAMSFLWGNRSTGAEA